MTDKEKVVNLLDELGVGYSLDSPYHSSKSNITMEADSGQRVTGYMGFICTFTFNDDGSFIEVGVWE